MEGPLSTSYAFTMNPHMQVEWKVISDEFEHQWNRPNCIGTIDDKHTCYLSMHQIYV
jgi:hypothetical protein